MSNRHSFLSSRHARQRSDSSTSIRESIASINQSNADESTHGGSWRDSSSTLKSYQQASQLEYEDETDESYVDHELSMDQGHVTRTSMVDSLLTSFQQLKLQAGDSGDGHDSGHFGIDTINALGLLDTSSDDYNGEGSRTDSGPSFHETTMPCRDAARRRYSTLELTSHDNDLYRGPAQQSRSLAVPNKPSPSTERNSVIGIPSTDSISGRTSPGIGRSNIDEHGCRQASQKGRVNASSSGNESLLATVPHDISRKFSSQSMHGTLGLTDSGERRKSASPRQAGPGLGLGLGSGGDIAGNAPSQKASSSLLPTGRSTQIGQDTRGRTTGNTLAPDSGNHILHPLALSRTSDIGHRTMDSWQTNRRMKASSFSAGQPAKERPGFFRRVFGLSATGTQCQGPELSFSQTPEEPPVPENVPLSSPLGPRFKQSLDFAAYNPDDDENHISRPSISGSSTSHSGSREKHHACKTSNVLRRRKKSSASLFSPGQLVVPRTEESQVNTTSPSRAQQFTQFLRPGRDSDPALGPMTARLAREESSNPASFLELKGFDSHENPQRRSATADQAEHSTPSFAYLLHPGDESSYGLYQHDVNSDWEELKQTFAGSREGQKRMEGGGVDQKWEDDQVNAEVTSRGPQVNIQNFSPPLAPDESESMAKPNFHDSGAAFDSNRFSSEPEITPPSPLYVDTPVTPSAVPSLSRHTSDAPELKGNALRAQRISPYLSGLSICDRDQALHRTTSTTKSPGSTSSTSSPSNPGRLYPPGSFASSSSFSSNPLNELVQITRSPDHTIKDPLQQGGGDAIPADYVDLSPEQRMKTTLNAEHATGCRSPPTSPQGPVEKSPMATRRHSLGHDNLTRKPSLSASKSLDCPSRETAEFLTPLLRSISADPLNEERPGTASTASTADARAMNPDPNEPSSYDCRIARVLYDLNDPLVTLKVTGNKPIAEWLGSLERSNMRKAYMKIFDFAGQNILVALRHLCSHLPLKAETQQIDRILDAFSHRWCECNPGHIFIAADVVHTITYSIILLNTDLHLADIDAKMTRSQFLNNTMPTIQRIVMENIAPESTDASHTRSSSFAADGQSSSVHLALDIPNKNLENDYDTSNSNDHGNAVTLTPSHHTAFTSRRSSTLAMNKPNAEPFSRNWEKLIENVLKDFYSSIQKNRLLLRGFPEAEESPHHAASHSFQSQFFGLGNLRRSPSAIGRVAAHAADRTSVIVGGGRWGSNKTRARPKLHPNSRGASSHGGQSRISLDEIGTHSVGMTAPLSHPASCSKLSLDSRDRLTLGSTDSFSSELHTASGGGGSSTGASSQGYSAISSTGTGVQPAIGFTGALNQAMNSESAVHDDHKNSAFLAPSRSADSSSNDAILDDDSLELEGAPWAKEGIVQHRRHIDPNDKKFKDRNWVEAFAVVQRGYLRLFSFGNSSKIRHQRSAKSSKGGGEGAVVGGGNWLDNAEEIASYHLRQTIASSPSAPGYKARQNVWALNLPNGSVHLFQVGTREIMAEFMSATNYWSARLSKEPLSGGVSNIEYGWSEAVLNSVTTPVNPQGNSNGNSAIGASSSMDQSSSQSLGGARSRSSIFNPLSFASPNFTSNSSWSLQPPASFRNQHEHGQIGGKPADRMKISDWMAPQQSTLSSTSTEMTQLRTLRDYVSSLEDELHNHGELRPRMTQAFSPRTQNLTKALENWDAKSEYLYKEIVKFRIYIETLAVAQSQRQEVYQKREQRAKSA